MALSGPIKTRPSWGGPDTTFGTEWGNLNRWDGLIQAATGAFGASNGPSDLAPVVLAQVLKAMMVIESQGEIYRNGSFILGPGTMGTATAARTARPDRGQTGVPRRRPRDRQVTVARDGGKAFRYAAVNSPLGRKKPLKKGEKVVEFVHSEEVVGEAWWWRSKNGNRINVAETVEKPYVVGS